LTALRASQPAGRRPQATASDRRRRQRDSCGPHLHRAKRRPV